MKLDVKASVRPLRRTSGSGQARQPALATQCSAASEQTA